MDVLFVTQTFPRFADDSAGPFIREIALGLCRRGLRVTILVPHAKGLPDRWFDQDLEIRVFRYAPPALEAIGYGRTLESDEAPRRVAALVTPLYAAAARSAVRRELRRRHYDLVHAHWIVPNAVVLARSRTPLFVGLHGSDVFLAERPGLRWLVRRCLERVVAVTSCSPEFLARLTPLGLRAGRGHVVPYGVDTQRFRPDAARRPLWRERLGIPAAATVLGSVGRMVTKKGFQVLLDALPPLFAAYPQTRLVLAGAGDRLSEFRGRAEAFGDRVLFPGLVLQDTLPDLYRALDAFVLPAVHDRSGNVDGLPNVILEAMASGLPVVASAISGIPLAVEDGATGSLTPEGDVEALSVALIQLVGDAGRRAAWGAAGRLKVERELTWDAVAGRYLDVYGAGLEEIRC